MAQRFLVFFFLGWFFFLMPANAAEEPYWKRTADLVKAGDYNMALEEADRLLAERQSDALLLRIRGICLMELNRLHDAIESFERVLAIDPESIAARYYLAQALAYQGDIPRAVELLKEIQKTAPDSAYAAHASKILPDLENLKVTRQALRKDKRWDASLRVGGEFDDNVLGRSRKEVDTTDMDSGRLITSASLEFRPIDEEIDRSWATLGLGYSIYQSWQERYEAFQHSDLTSQTARVFVRHADEIGSMPLKMQVSSSYTHSRLGNQPYGEDVGVGTHMDLQWLPQATFSPSYSIKWKWFENDTIIPEVFSRDGYSQTVGGSQRFYVLKNKAVLSFSYSYHWNEADGSQFDTDGYDLTGSADVALPWKFRFSGGVTYSSEDYLKFAPKPERLDDVVSVFSSVSHPLWRDDVILQFTYTHSTGDSTVDYADSRRNVYGLAVSYYA